MAARPRMEDVVFVVLVFLTGVLCSYPDPKEDRCPGNYTSPLKAQSVLVLGKVALWLLYLLLARYLQHHHSRARGRGYSSIDRATQPLKTLALLTHSAGNAALLLVLGVQHSFPGRGRLYLMLILAVLALELLCCLTWLLLYAVKIRRFNRAKPQPDVLEEEKLYAHPSSLASETGFRTAGSLEEVVEKQADIIAYLQRHNALLSRRLLALVASPPGRT
ncbi:transmembrane protein 192 isoform X2 [Octodon degus]|uniref:Transmembrane protein 192 n=1 Tax=Octodon degus TaxID=10160 RepID=A0A6P6EER8_OCTDE|nr:transmembrane protein 192 isoform X2 [Octodon degus]